MSKLGAISKAGSVNERLLSLYVLPSTAQDHFTTFGNVMRTVMRTLTTSI